MSKEKLIIRITCGSGVGPTEIASYDAALHDAGISNYNLVQVSSVIPKNAKIEVVNEMPYLVPFGNRLWVVQAKTTRRKNEGDAVAGLAWAESENAGIFYESSGGRNEDEVREELIQGIESCKELRKWKFGETNMEIKCSNKNKNEFVTSVVIGIYGESESMFRK